MGERTANREVKYYVPRKRMKVENTRTCREKFHASRIIKDVLNHTFHKLTQSARSHAQRRNFSQPFSILRGMITLRLLYAERIYLRFTFWHLINFIEDSRSKKLISRWFLLQGLNRSVHNNRWSWNSSRKKKNLH